MKKRANCQKCESQKLLLVMNGQNIAVHCADCMLWVSWIRRSEAIALSQAENVIVSSMVKELFSKHASNEARKDTQNATKNSAKFSPKPYRRVSQDFDKRQLGNNIDNANRVNENSIKIRPVKKLQRHIDISRNKKSR